MNQSDRRERRAMIARLASNGEELGVIARTLGVGMQTIYLACRENGVRLIDLRQKRIRAVRGMDDIPRAESIVRRVLFGETYNAVGLDLGITRQRAQQIFAAFSREYPAVFGRIKAEALRAELAQIEAQQQPALAGCRASARGTMSATDSGLGTKASRARRMVMPRQY